MSDETKPPRERLREALELWERCAGGPGDWSHVLDAARSVLAQPEPALTATDEFIGAMHELRLAAYDPSGGEWTTYGAKLQEMALRLLRAPWPEPAVKYQELSADNERLAEQLADKARERERAEELWERTRTIADEAFGPFPVQSADVALDAIERGAFEQRKRIVELEAERDRLQEEVRKWVNAEGAAAEESIRANAEALSLKQELESCAPAMTGAERDWCCVADRADLDIIVEALKDAGAFKAAEFLSDLHAERHPPKRTLADVLDDIQGWLDGAVDEEVRNLVAEARRLIDAEKAGDA
jgi:hypothetical protein